MSGVAKSLDATAIGHRTAVRPTLHLEDMSARFARVPSLDGLRAASILIVLSSHYIDAQLIPGGFGVLVFFVVSGYLIARLLFAEAKADGRTSLRNFYLRRVFRLYPVIVAYTLVVLAVALAAGHAIDWWEPLSALFYFANYLYAHLSEGGRGGSTMPFGVFWSLSVEEHFYLFFPLLFVLLRGTPGAIARAMAWTIATCLALRILLAFLRPDLLGTHWFYYSELRLDSIAFGVLLAASCETVAGRRLISHLEHPAVVAAALCVLLACFVVRNPWFRETLRYSLQAAAVSALLAAALFSPRYRTMQTLLNAPFLCWIGVLSYSLYVWHSLVPELVRGAMPAAASAQTTTADFLIAFALATISYYALERPAMALRHRFGSRTV